jgi:protein TonB
VKKEFSGSPAPDQPAPPRSDSSIVPSARSQPATTDSKSANEFFAASGSGATNAVASLPNYRSNPAPSYPFESRRLKQQGLVWLDVEVAESGDPRNVRVARTSGFPALDAAALDAVRRWKFEPARLGGRAIAARVEVPVRFRLQD